MTIRFLIWTWMLLISLLCQKAWAIPSKILTQQDKQNIIEEEWSKTIPSLKETIPTEQPPIIKKEVELPQLSEKITLKAVNLPLQEVLEPVAQNIGCHLILGPGVESKNVSANFVDTQTEKVLNTLLFPLGYGFKIKDGNLIVLAVETKVYRIVLPPIIQNFKDLTSNESSVESNKDSNSANKSSNNNSSQQVKLGTKIQVSNESPTISFWDDVIENLKSLVSVQGKFSINKSAGVVIVTDTPISHQRITQYFEELNSRVAQQLEVDVKVVEVSLNHENHFGVDWNALADDLKTLNSLGLSSNFASEHFTSGSVFRITGNGSKPGSGVTESGIKVAINALAKQGNVDVVSQPRVRILNNQVAVIQVGSTQSYVDNTSLEVTQTGTITSISTSQVQEGVTMRLLGNIVGDDIYLSVTPVVTTIDNIRSITSGSTKIEAPQTTTKSINTLVKVKEGETVVIGGLITSYHQKNKETVPIISKIPLLGKLFQYDENKNTKSELIIFITPKRG